MKPSKGLLRRIQLFQALAGRSSKEAPIRWMSSHQRYRTQPKVSRIKIPGPSPLEPRTVAKRRLIHLGGVVFFFVGLYATYSYIRAPVVQRMASKVPADVSDRYDKIARDFDSEVGITEKIYGYGWLRSWITKEATGNVLEVSAGTGRNSAYYNLKNCKSITLVDQSREMMEIAEEKFRSLSRFLHRVVCH